MPRSRITRRSTASSLMVVMDQGIDLVQALERLHRGVDAEVAGSALRRALEWTKSEPENIG